MLEAQGGKCAICPARSSDHGKKFHVDHCHETGKVRALLCNNCNNGLGRFKDNAEYLINAANYIKFHQSTNV
jgi:Recombination endonuclease VII